MEKNELVITTAKEILIAAMAKDSKIDLKLSVQSGEAQVTDLGERFKTLSTAVSAALKTLDS